MDLLIFTRKGRNIELTDIVVAHKSGKKDSDYAHAQLKMTPGEVNIAPYESREDEVLAIAQRFLQYIGLLKDYRLRCRRVTIHGLPKEEITKMLVGVGLYHWALHLSKAD